MRFGSGAEDPYAGTGGTGSSYTGPGSPGYDYSNNGENPGAGYVKVAEGGWVFDPTRPAGGPSAPSSLPSWVKPVGIALAAVGALYWMTSK